MTSRLHPLLVRQLKRCFGRAEDVPANCQSLIDVVNDAYLQADVDRTMLERSLELSSEELGDANASLQHAVLELQVAHRDMEARVAERTRELDAANEDLRQAQKMDAVGKLAGGIAHDFNNLLTVIEGCTDVLLDGRAPHEGGRVELEEIRRSTGRAAALTQQLLAFGRKQVLDAKIIDLNRVVLGMQTMLSRLIREDISVAVDTAPGAAWVRLDPNQIEQVLLNLVLNARDALPSGGHIRIDVAHERPVAPPGRAGAPPGNDLVRLRVSDNGVGMTPDVRAHVFEPFFTTKPSGKGTGLGLASVHGIVHQSNGIITVDSAEGLGTTFSMFFPIAVPEPAAGAVVEGTPGGPGNAETVLLVEDEDPVRRVIRTMLERRGYRVLEAATPHEAVVLFERHGQEIDVLVTDVIMPEMNGPNLARRLLAVRPDLPVLFISGHSDVEGSLLGLDRPGIGFLAKPLQAARLTTKVRELLTK